MINSYPVSKRGMTVTVLSLLLRLLNSAFLTVLATA
jgi:hypothetical protein